MPHFFISYRRSDQGSQYLAHMISRELHWRYGAGSAFLDVVSPRTPGLVFQAKIDQALRAADAVLVIIGPEWLQQLTERVNTRDLDWVRYEISESLKRDSLPVVAVCLAGVEMPLPCELPEELQGLCLRHAFSVDPFQGFEAGLEHILSDLENRAQRLGQQLQAAEWASAGARRAHFFISYRHGDQEGQYLAHMISREIHWRYGPASAFLSADLLMTEPSFQAEVDRALKVIDFVLVIIGPLWLQRLAERVRDPWDWVRYEISESLKRDSLPVVPVCRAGVEMPREHELPEELRRLCKREAVFLDPFKDFEADLARTLSDLEELQVARGKLIAILRWQAGQLELAEARHAADLRETERATHFAARVAQAKAEAKMRVDKWLEEAESVEPGAARVPGPATRSMPPKYYQDSNHYTIGGAGLSLLASGLVIFALAFGYSYSLLHLPFVQLNFLLALLYGLFSGWSTGLILCWRKVRNFGAAAFVGLTSGLAAVYLSWAVWIYGNQDLFKKLGFTGLLALVASPVSLWHDLYHLNGVGSWDIWGYKPTGFVLWVLWSLEAILIIAFSIGVPPLIVIMAAAFGVVCEACGTRCKRQHGAKLRHCDPEQLKQHLETKDLAYLVALGPPSVGATQWLDLTLSRCRKCGKTNTLDATHMTVTTDGEGYSTTREEELVSGLLLTAAECIVIQKIGQWQWQWPRSRLRSR